MIRLFVRASTRTPWMTRMRTCRTSHPTMAVPSRLKNSSCGRGIVGSDIAQRRHPSQLPIRNGLMRRRPSRGRPRRTCTASGTGSLGSWNVGRGAANSKAPRRQARSRATGSIFKATTGK
ncbi:hypothetical protein EMCG_03913 [[Emmonsia] crescens]|uniref:Uncharacterized protein n=1 Tax=[Emmonsia] crescens TaxID=73230 RepID=A0A0G2IZI7_9EURO|nr:hypothetical protein EMCG_03913 [Emmonsia crescens UAMH 3008]